MLDPLSSAFWVFPSIKEPHDHRSPHQTPLHLDWVETLIELALRITARPVIESIHAFRRQNSCLTPTSPGIAHSVTVDPAL